MIRDQALAASGLLVTKIGGPSVKPYHPPGLYEQVVAQRDNPKATYQPGEGRCSRRRSLYTYWKRQRAASRDVVFRRALPRDLFPRPPAHQHPAAGAEPDERPDLRRGGAFSGATDVAGRWSNGGGAVGHGFRLLLARAPKGEELAVLKQALARAQADFGKDPEAAKASSPLGEAKHEASLDPVELASYATVAMTLLNLDEAVMK